MAFKSGLWLAMWARWASRTSTEDTSSRRIASASTCAGVKTPSIIIVSFPILLSPACLQQRHHTPGENQSHFGDVAYHRNSGVQEDVGKGVVATDTASVDAD